VLQADTLFLDSVIVGDGDVAKNVLFAELDGLTKMATAPNFGRLQLIVTCPHYGGMGTLMVANDSGSLGFRVFVLLLDFSTYSITGNCDGEGNSCGGCGDCGGGGAGGGGVTGKSTGD